MECAQRAREAATQLRTQTREAKDSDDLATIKGVHDKLTAASHKLAEVMYQGQQGEAPEAGGESEGGSGGDDVIDAEYEDA